MPYATIWVDFEGIGIVEISRRKTNTVLPHLYVGSKIQQSKKQAHGYREQIGGCQRQKEEGQNGLRDKISKSWACTVQHSDCI